MWVDMMPSHEKKRLRKRMRSPEAYEKLRQRVQGPEKLKEQMERNSNLAELGLALELEPRLKEELKKEIEKDVQNMSIDQVFVNPENVSEQAQDALDAGRFDVAIDTNPDTNEDQLVLTPEGNISEKLPVKFSLSEKYASQLGGAL